MDVPLLFVAFAVKVCEHLDMRIKGHVLPCILYYSCCILVTSIVHGVILQFITFIFFCMSKLFFFNLPLSAPDPARTFAAHAFEPLEHGSMIIIIPWPTTMMSGLHAQST